MTARRWARYGTAALLACALGAGAVVAVANPPKGGFPPDPPSQSTRKQWVFDVTYKGGVASATRARAAMRDKPAGSARVFGRFAVELWVGKELLDRVRFNVPLTGDDRDPAGAENDPDRRTDRSPFKRPRFDQVTTRTVVQIADSPRAAWAQVIDRATGATRKYWWPPEPDGTLLPMVPAAAVDGGADGGDGGPRPAGTAARDGSAGAGADAGPSGGGADAAVREGGATPARPPRGAAASDAGRR
jgi:hypothetical protein